MAIEEIEFRLSEMVNKRKKVVLFYIPPAGSKISIVEIIGEGSYSSNSEVKVIWDYDGTDELLWVIKGSGKFSNKIIINSDKADGVRKLALVLDNGETDSLNMAGHMTILVDTNE